MLSSLHKLQSAPIHATDGTIGPVDEAYFDDKAWVVRYLVVDTGSWLSGRKVLLSPYAVRQPVGTGGVIDVNLTRQQVRDSPNIDTHLTVSRRHEIDFARYYAYPDYWDGGGLWGTAAYPLPPALSDPLMPQRPGEARIEVADKRTDDVPAEDVHLRSSAAVKGYHIQAADGSIGHVEDFIVDDRSFAVRYLCVDTRNWWPGGRKVLLAVSRIDRIDWAERAVYTTLTREQLKNSPAYDDQLPISPENETRLFDYYQHKPDRA